MLIGLLGSTGTIGNEVFMHLKKEYNIRIGTRNTGKLLPADCEYMSVDITKSDQLEAFCIGCKIIINCAGPSYQLSPLVANAAIKANAHYVDVFGGPALEKEFMNLLDLSDSTSIICAGSNPGLSGLLPKWLIKKYFDRVDKLICYAGGREKCSYGSGLDVLLSSINDYGIPDGEIKDGEISKGISEDAQTLYLSFQKEDVYLQKFLHEEYKRLAFELDIQDAVWYNIVPDLINHETISNSCKRMLRGADDNILYEEILKLQRISNMVTASREQWYAFIVEISGEKDGIATKKRCILNSNNSYKLCSFITLHAVKKIMEKRVPSGLYWAYNILDPEEVIEELLKSDIIKNCVIENFIDNFISNNSEEVQEGLI